MSPYTHAEDLMAGREPFISRVRLTNYKSIAACDVKLGPLTILIGPNGSGKSNFLDGLAFLARAIETTPNQAIDERGGLDAILRRVPARADSFSIEVEVALLFDEVENVWAHATYGFEVASSDDSRRPFTIRNERCSLELPSRSLHFEVHEGTLLDNSRGVSLPDENIEPDRLYLQVAGISKSYAELQRHLREMQFYNFTRDTLREAQPDKVAAILGNRGERLPNALKAMGSSHRRRLNAYLRAIVPGVTSVESRQAGPYLTLRLNTAGGEAGRDYQFDPLGMSDGTTRAIAILVALFQRAVFSGRVPLVGIEEPEAALHPGAAGVLFDALSEASGWVQVIATSQSPDLLDRDDLDVDIVRAVSMEQGLTAIGEIDDASRSIVQDKLYTLGELMRGNQISPGSQPGREVADPGE